MLGVFSCRLWWVWEVNADLPVELRENFWLIFCLHWIYTNGEWRSTWVCQLINTNQGSYSCHRLWLWREDWMGKRGEASILYSKPIVQSHFLREKTISFNRIYILCIHYPVWIIRFHSHQFWIIFCYLTSKPEPMWALMTFSTLVCHSTIHSRLLSWSFLWLFLFH